MTGRERFLLHVICPKCGQHGVVIWEKSEEPVYRRGEWSTVLTRTSDGFRSGSRERIFCVDCAVEAVMGSNGPKS